MTQNFQYGENYSPDHIDVDTPSKKLEFTYPPNNSYSVAHWISPLISWLWDNRNKILQDVENNVKLAGDHYGFHVFYPMYGGMPVEISQHLNEGHLEIINKHAVFMLEDYPDKDLFKKKFVAVLTNSTIVLT